MVHSDDTEDHWSDAPETLDDDRPDLDDAVHQEADMIQQHDGDITIRAVAVSVDAVDKIDQSAVSHSSRGASMSTPPPTEPVSDAASIHSLPAVYVTEPDTSPRRPSPILTNRAPPSSPVPPPSPSHSNISSTASAQQRRHRHRSAVEVGFISVGGVDVLTRQHRLGLRTGFQVSSLISYIAVSTRKPHQLREV